MANPFDPSVQDLLVPALDAAYPSMAYGEGYASITGLFQKRDMSGLSASAPCDVDLGGGTGNDAATAYANATLNTRAQWQVTAYKTYGFTQVPLFDDAFTKGPESAADLLMDESKAAMNKAKLAFDQALSSDGFGTLATVKSAATTDSGATYTITFAYASEVLKFRPKMVLTQKTTANAGSLNAGTGLVTNVAQGSKQIKVTCSGGFVPTATHVVGEQSIQAASSAFSTWPGLLAIIPPIASRPLPPGTVINGVDVSQDETKLAGSALDATNMDYLEAINQLDAMISNVPGASPDTVLCSMQTKAKIMSDLQTQRRYSETREVQGPGIDVFFKVVTIHGVAGDLDIVGSSNFPDNYIMILSRKDWVLGSPGNRPFVPATANGKSPVVEIPGLDACVVKYRAQGFVYCRAPGGSGIATIRP